MNRMVGGKTSDNDVHQVAPGKVAEGCGALSQQTPVTEALTCATLANLSEHQQKSPALVMFVRDLVVLSVRQFLGNAICWNIVA